MRLPRSPKIPQPGPARLPLARGNARHTRPAAAQQQLSHAQHSTTDAHYLWRQTSGPDVPESRDRFAAGENDDGKYQLMGVSRSVFSAFPLKAGAPEGIRTPNLLIRSQML